MPSSNIEKTVLMKWLKKRDFLVNEISLKKVAVGVNFGEGKEKKGRKRKRVVMQVFYVEIPIQQWPNTNRFSKSNLIFLGETTYRSTVVKLHYEYTVYSILHIIHYYT